MFGHLPDQFLKLVLVVAQTMLDGECIEDAAVPVIPRDWPYVFSESVIPEQL